MRIVCLWLWFVMTVAAAHAGGEKLIVASQTEPAVARYLVTLSDSASLDDAGRIAAHYGVRLEPFARDGFRGFMIVATPRKARLLSTDARVARVEEQPSVPRESAPFAAATVVAHPTADATGGVRNLGVYTYDAASNVSTVIGDYGTEAFQYDTLGRVTGSTTTLGTASVGQSYEYDRYGNLKVMQTVGASAVRRFGANPATNRFDLATDPMTQLPANVLATYSPSGSVLSVTWKDPNLTATFVYDPVEVVAESNVFGAQRQYVYDARDERILAIGGAQEWTLRGLSGEVLRRFSSAAGGSLQWEEDYVYRGTAMLASLVPGPEKLVHFHLDHLGTPRLITGNGGALVSEHRYFPFGEEITSRNQDPETKKFTGHERDLSAMGAIGDLDYMHARYYGPALGRFLSIDRTWRSAKLDRPQSWNRYSYVLNNPANLTDPDGNNWLWWLLDLAGEIAIETAGEELRDATAEAATGYLQTHHPDEGKRLKPVPIPPAVDNAAQGPGQGPGEWEFVNEDMSDNAADYQEQVTGVPAGMAYVVDGVKFDGYADGTLLEAKGERYANFTYSIGKETYFTSWFSGAQRLVQQGQNQQAAARGIPVVWHVAEKEAAEAIRSLFAQNRIKIEVVHDPKR